MATGFNGLDDAAPNDNAYIGDGAAEIRAVKNALITTFPAVDGEITKPTGYGPVSGSTQPTADDYTQLFTDMGALVSPDTTNSPVVPQGLVAMWNGNTGDAAAITELNSKGWYLCTGGVAPNGYTIPNLQDRFVKGWGTNPVGNVSGGGNLGTLRTGKALVAGSSTDKTVTNTVTIAEANLPEHRHQIAKSVTGNDYQGNGAGQASSNTLVGSATSGSSDHEYDLVGISGAEADIFQSGKYGNSSPTALDIGIDAAQFNHEHEVIASGDLEPTHYVIAYIIYAGVV